MHDNVYWKAFLLFVFVCALIYSGIATYRYYEYSSLTSKLPITQQVDWDIYEKSDEDFILIAKYQFVVKDASFTGETYLSDQPYRNKWAAQKAIEDYTKDLTLGQLNVWFDPLSPNHSSLQKHFPVKQCVYAVFLWGLFLYFIWLGTCVTKSWN